MRKEMINAVSKRITENKNTVLFLVDIGVWGFHKILESYPERVFNVGIFEDGMVSIAAGLALGGVEPTIYGISPFIVERALEQLKLNFAYQKVGGNFITTGAAYDFSSLGYSHYCAEDVGVLRNIPGIEFIAPGTGDEFVRLFEACAGNGHPTYYRLSDYDNSKSYNVEFGKATIIKKGKEATVIAIGTMLDTVLKAVEDQDVTVLYYTTLLPFDCKTLKDNCPSGKILVCGPEFKGSLDAEILSCFEGQTINISHVELPLEIFRNYGTKLQKDEFYGLTSENIRKTLVKLI